MKELFSIIRICCCIVALPIAATAAATGYQLINDNQLADLLPEDSGTISVSTTELTTQRNHTLRLDDEGRIFGRIVSIAASSEAPQGIGQLDVSIFRDGSIATTAITDADGGFVVSGLTAGVYAFIARGNAGMVAFGVNVLPYEEGAATPPLEAAAITNTPLDILAAVQEPVEHYHFRDDEDVSLDVVGGNSVFLDEGTLRGNLYSMYTHYGVADTEITIAQDGVSVATVAANPDGSFEIPGLAPGIYEFLAYGPKGYATVSFEAVARGHLTQAITETKETFTSTTEPTTEPTAALAPLSSFSIMLIPFKSPSQEPTPVFLDETVTSGCAMGANACGPVSTSGCGGCCGTGFGGGAGGAGFGGGRNGLLGLAGLTTGIIALADSSSSSAPPSSPANP